jgi:class 3 adenylate cyclase
MPQSGEGPGDRDEVAAILGDLGVPAESIERAIERGDPEAAVLESTLRAGQAERTLSPADVEARGGLSAGEVVEVLRAMGFPPPETTEPTLTPAEAEVFVELAQLRDVWPHELTQQLARMYGRLLARIARTGVQSFRLHAEPRAVADAGSRADQLRAVRDVFARLGSLPDPLLTGVHRRWLEYEVAQSIAGADESETSKLPGTVEISLLFCDLKDFTAYANAQGDAAAVEAIDAFAQTVDAERGEDGRVVKALGDGHMLCYGDASQAVAAGERIIAEMRASGPLGVHASTHRGLAIAREGDYFGEAVNLAARLLGIAERDQLVATAPVVDSCGERFDWESLGRHTIRGVAEPVEAFLLRAR